MVAHFHGTAKSKNREFNLTKEYIWYLFENQKGRCKYTKEKLIFPINENNNIGNISLDRIDNKRGYVIDNIQLVYKPINRMKLDYSEEEFLFYCQKVAEHNV